MNFNINVNTNNKPNIQDSNVRRLNYTLGMNDGSTNLYRVLTVATSPTATEFKPDEWYHVVATYSGDTSSLYINGVLYETKTNSNYFAIRKPETAKFVIGSNNDFSLGQYSGDMAIARLYSTALSAEEIAALAEKELTPVVDKTALEEKVAEGKELIETDYSAETWAVFAEELAKAEEILGSEDVTQEQVDEALKLLTEAMENLAVDKALLEDKVTKVKD